MKCLGCESELTESAPHDAGFGATSVRVDHPAPACPFWEGRFKAWCVPVEPLAACKAERMREVPHGRVLIVPCLWLAFSRVPTVVCPRCAAAVALCEFHFGTGVGPA
jgi:hypothetical protein